MPKIDLLKYLLMIKAQRLIFYICLLITYITLPVVLIAANPQEEYKQIQRNLDIHKKKLEATKKAERSVLNELRKTNMELNEIENNIAQQRKKIGVIQNSIKSVQEDINTYNGLILKQGKLLKKRFWAIQRYKEHDDTMLSILTEFNQGLTFRMSRYLLDIAAYDAALIAEYKDTVERLDDKKQKLNKLHVSLKTEENKLLSVEQSLKEKRAEREALLTTVRKEKRTYQQMVNELQEASQRLQKILQELDRQERETKKRQTVKPSTKPGKLDDIDDSPFARLKGRLHWPVTGTVAVQYGSQTDPLFNLPIFRSGIHIKTPSGINVKASVGGKVVYADEFKGYGKLVILSHGDSYHTLYGNLARIFASKGTLIKDLEPLGIVGDDPVIGTTGLYFEIRYKGKPLDPQQWLKK